MSTTISLIDEHLPPNYLLDVRRVFTGEQFEQLCRDNRDLRFELTAHGVLIIMPPTGSKAGLRNAGITPRLCAWSESSGAGHCFDSSTGFRLPSGARRSPDAAWVKRERWESLTEAEQEGFAPLCPDFVIELRWRSDDLPPLQAKLIENGENG
jgi:Uma2 family endonuclease